MKFRGEGGEGGKRAKPRLASLPRNLILCSFARFAVARFTNFLKLSHYLCNCGLCNYGIAKVINFQLCRIYYVF